MDWGLWDWYGILAKENYFLCYTVTICGTVTKIKKKKKEKRQPTKKNSQNPQTKKQKKQPWASQAQQIYW